MRSVVLQLNVTDGRCFLGLVVVLHVIRAKPRVGVADLYVAIRADDVTLAALRTARGHFGHLAFCRRVNLLRRSVNGEDAANRSEKDRHVEKTTERSINRCSKIMMIHAGHVMESKR